MGQGSRCCFRWNMEISKASELKPYDEKKPAMEGSREGGFRSSLGQVWGIASASPGTARHQLETR